MNKEQSVSKASPLPQIRKLVNTNNLTDAVSYCNDYIRRHRRDPHGWELLGEINFRGNNFQNAVHCFEKALDLRPYNPSYHMQLGRCRIKTGDRRGALAAALKAAELNPSSAGTLDGIGAIFSFCDEQHKALEFFQQAVTAEPDNAHYLYNLASVQRMVGALDAAEATCNRTIQLNPHDYKAYYTRSDLRTWSESDNHIEQMSSLLSSGISAWRGKMLIHYALAKELEDVKRYAESFRHLKSANQLQRKHMDYDVESDMETLDKLISTHKPEALIDKSGGHDTDEPVFILGLPRTGTTLVERILASHSKVCSAGELNNFAVELIKAVQNNSGGSKFTKQEMVEKSLTVDKKGLGQAYLDSTRPRTGHTAYFIDKMPQNVLYCGLIHAALPKARIIHLNRNPMDTCYAIYKTIFTHAYPYSYDLDDLGRYYIAYHRLMEHWRTVIGNNMLEVSYEYLVHDQERQSRRIVEFCGLEWEDACLQFYESKSAATTASATQVRQPVYQSSVGRWKNHEEQLQPLIRLFKENNIDYL